MATGYTADVGDGKVTEFRTFALRCARAFGATIMQRDDPPTDAPKHREPSDYSAKELVKAHAEVTRLAAMTVVEAAGAMEAECIDVEARNAEWRSSRDEETARFRAMLDQVEAWEPPTLDHAEMKKFMASQLTTSIGPDWIPDAPPVQTAEEWLAAKRAKAARDVEYHTKANAEEIERCVTANAWIDALYASLPAAADPAQIADQREQETDVTAGPVGPA